MNPRGPAFSWYARIVARTTFAVINNIYCIPAYVVWMMVLRLLRPICAPLYWKIEGLMYHWLLAMVSMWSWTAGYEIVETGDEPVACYNRRTLVLANHQSTADVPMLMAAWNPRPGVLPNLMWIMDRVFKFTNFGIVSVLHEDFFIQAGKAKRDQSLEELRQHIHKFYMPLSRQFMVLFPEGGFLHKRREVSQRFAEKNNLPKLEYVSLPRAGALKVIMEETGPHRDQGASTSKEIKKDNNSNQSRKMIVDNDVGDSVEWVLDVTIAYPDRIPIHLQDVVCGFRQPCTTHLHYRLYPSTEIPSDTEGMTQWLYDRFVEKDQMLEEFYKTGKFPTSGNIPSVPRKVRQDNVWARQKRRKTETRRGRGGDEAETRLFELYRRDASRTRRSQSGRSPRCPPGGRPPRAPTSPRPRPRRVSAASLLCVSNKRRRRKSVAPAPCLFCMFCVATLLYILYERDAEETKVRAPSPSYVSSIWPTP